MNIEVRTMDAQGVETVRIEQIGWVRELITSYLRQGTRLYIETPGGTIEMWPNASDLEGQERVFSFICVYIEENGYSPTHREICDGAGISSTSMASFYIKRLVADGRLERDVGRARSIRVVQTP